MPAVPAAGVPESVAVPLPLSWKITPDGNDPVTDKVDVGKPVVGKMYVPAAPTWNVSWAGEVMAGGMPTTRDTVWVAESAMPSFALYVKLSEPK